MEPTASSGTSRPRQTGFVFENGESPEGTPARAGQPGRDCQPENGLGTNLHSLAADSTPARAQTPSAEGGLPRWLRILERLAFVLICLQLGLMLVVLPWEPVWNTNVFLADFPALRAIVQNCFVRGLVTGLGIVDLWLGITEAARHREPKPQNKVPVK
jgi:hypothetical protein